MSNKKQTATAKKATATSPKLKVNDKVLVFAFGEKSDGDWVGRVQIIENGNVHITEGNGRNGRAKSVSISRIIWDSVVRKFVYDEFADQLITSRKNQADQLQATPLNRPATITVTFELEKLAQLLAPEERGKGGRPDEKIYRRLIEELVEQEGGEVFKCETKNEGRLASLRVNGLHVWRFNSENESLIAEHNLNTILGGR